MEECKAMNTGTQYYKYSSVEAQNSNANSDIVLNYVDYALVTPGAQNYMDYALVTPGAQNYVDFALVTPRAKNYQ